MTIERKLSARQLIWKEAVVDQVERHERFSIFEYGLAESLMRRYPAGLQDVIRFFDPEVPGAALAGDPGWSMYRKPEAGERYRFFSALNARHPERPQPWPVPGPEEGATPDWPISARFLAQADVPEDLGDPAYPEEYFTAAEVHEYIRRLMPVYAKYHPESQAQCDHILALSQWWVDHDASAPCA